MQVLLVLTLCLVKLPPLHAVPATSPHRPDAGVPRLAPATNVDKALAGGDAWWRARRVRGTAEGSLRFIRVVAGQGGGHLDWIAGDGPLQIMLLPASCAASEECWQIDQPNHVIVKRSSSDHGETLTLSGTSAADEPTVFELQPVADSEQIRQLDEQFAADASVCEAARTCCEVLIPLVTHGGLRCRFDEEMGPEPSTAACRDFLHNASSTLATDGIAVPAACSNGLPAPGVTPAPSAQPTTLTDAGMREGCSSRCTDEFKACIVAAGGFDPQTASDCGRANSRCRDSCR
jgi:hypothetical protein